MDIRDFLQGSQRRVLFARTSADHDPVLLYAGIHRLEAGQAAIRFKDHFTWHLVLDGRAEAGIDGTAHRLGPGDGFLYLPRQEKHLRAGSGGCTWSWIGFEAVTLVRDCHDLGITGCRVVPGLDQAFRAWHLALLDELLDPGLRHERECGARLQILINAVLRRIGHPHAPAPDRHEAIAKAQHLIVTRAGTGMTVADLARAVGLERSYFSRLFHQELGTTVREALAAARLRLAERLLLDPSQPIHAVADLSGFSDYFSFHRFFKRESGLSPSAFRARTRS